MKNLLKTGVIASACAMALMSSAADASMTIGDVFSVQYMFPVDGVFAIDYGEFVYVGPGQQVYIEDGTTSIILYDDHVIFSEEPGCGDTCYHIAADYNGPVLFNLTNNFAFAGWTVLADNVGITSSILEPDRISVNWQGKPVQGEVTVGAPITAAVPEPASWALMLAGFGAIGGAMRHRRKAAINFA